VPPAHKGWKIEKWAGTDNSQLTSAATAQLMEYWMVTTTDDKGNKALCGGMIKRVQPLITGNQRQRPLEDPREPQ